MHPVSGGKRSLWYSVISQPCVVDGDFFEIGEIAPSSVSRADSDVSKYDIEGGQPQVGILLAYFHLIMSRMFP